MLTIQLYWSGPCKGWTLCGLWVPCISYIISRQAVMMCGTHGAVITSKWLHMVFHRAMEHMWHYGRSDDHAVVAPETNECPRASWVSSTTGDPLKIDHPVDRRTKEVFNGCDTPNGAHQTIEVNLVGGIFPGSSSSGVLSHGRRGRPKFQKSI